MGTKTQTQSGCSSDPTNGRTHAIDRILDQDLSKRNAPLPKPATDETFVRRAYLDTIGLLPTPEELDAFLTSDSNKTSAIGGSIAEP